MSMMVSIVLSFFPRGVLDEILNLIESISEGFPSYSKQRRSLHSTCVYFFFVYFVKIRGMPYAEITEIVMTSTLPENTVDFPRYRVWRQKVCVKKLIPRHMLSCLCDVFIFC